MKCVVLFGLGSLLSAAVLALMGCGNFKRNEEYGTVVIGIDLGTTSSGVGVFRNGRVEIIAKDIPSYVAFNDQEPRLIGEAAKNQAILNPENTLFDIKRLIGRDFSDPTVQDDIELLPFQIVNETGKPKIQIRAKPRREDKFFAPEEISAMVIARLKDIAEAYLGGEPVQFAVITVPAYFNDAQRQATKAAGTIAGLNVLRIINEPTAAAIAYGFDQEVEEKNILVYDLGGGTFDVSILVIDSGVFEVLSTAGNTHLGGEDFDERVMRYLLHQFQKKTGFDCFKDKKALQKLRQESERAKRILSQQYQVRIEIEAFCQGEDLSDTLTRAKFEELNMDLFKKTLEPVQIALDDAELTKGEIHEVVLVGGSTHIPMVQQLLKDFFESKTETPNLVHGSINPDEAVTYGAAIQAGVLSNEEATEGLITLDIAPLTLGIETVGGVMTPIIERGYFLPTKKSQVFSTTHDNQDRVTIQVFEGERPMTKDNHFLGKFDFSGIDHAPRGIPQIEVTFEIDVDGILSVRAQDMESKSLVSFIFTNEEGRLSEEEIERMIEEARVAREEDEALKEIVQARNQLENSDDLPDLKRCERRVSEDEKSIVEEHLEQTAALSLSCSQASPLLSSPEDLDQ